mmetsp:Transcript_115486/g.224632  ORF Transcript_115486/g.224632 Transcript_115486/m.224632 type:complete len:275 (+) Transcript_115486:863-1687(+)
MLCRRCHRGCLYAACEPVKGFRSSGEATDYLALCEGISPRRYNLVKARGPQVLKLCLHNPCTPTVLRDCLIAASQKLEACLSSCCQGLRGLLKFQLQLLPPHLEFLHAGIGLQPGAAPLKLSNGLPPACQRSLSLLQGSLPPRTSCSFPRRGCVVELVQLLLCNLQPLCPSFQLHAEVCYCLGKTSAERRIEAHSFVRRTPVLLCSCRVTSCNNTAPSTPVPPKLTAHLLSILSCCSSATPQLLIISIRLECGSCFFSPMSTVWQVPCLALHLC